MQSGARRGRQPSAESNSLEDRFCAKPFESFERQENGSVHLCCPARLRQRTGNLNDSTAAEIWNSPAAQEVRKGILDGSFSAAEHDDPCVWSPAHPLHAEFARAIADPSLADPVVFLGSLADARRVALGRAADALQPAN